jgi:CMP-N-acetylneuraminic acid synthetase
MPSVDDLFIIIPARGGSKGIPRKNIKPLAGWPLLAWSAEAVRMAGLGSARCILSTDDMEIAECGRSHGLEVPFLRPAQYATDISSMVDVASHALQWLVGQGQTALYILMLLPTHPFRAPSQLHAALDVFADPSVDGVMSVMTIHRSLSTLFYADDSMALTPLGAPVPAERRQDVRPIYTPSGCFFYARVAALREQQTFYTRNVRGIVTDPITSMDLDTPMEWSMAEAIAAAGLTWRGSLSVK